MSAKVLRTAFLGLTLATLSTATIAQGSTNTAAKGIFNDFSFDGWVSGTYVHRLKNSGDSNLSTGYFSHPNANTFQLNQAWLAVDKAPTAQSRAGIHFDYVVGTIAGAQRGNTTSDGDDGLVYSAYVSYLANIGNGVQFDVGRIVTLIGGEVLQTNGNFAITRGILFGLQPITHTGAMARTNLGGGWNMALGVVNDVYSDTINDSSSQKVATGQVSWTGNKVYAGLSTIYGQDNSMVTAGGNSCAPNGDCQLGIVDLLVTADVSDSTSVWLDTSYLFNRGNDQTEQGSAFGVAAAGRVALNGRSGLAGRFEYINLNQKFVAAGAGTPRAAASGSNQYSITGTYDFSLTSNLTMRAEVRYDNSKAPIFVGSTPAGQGTQVTGLLELVYNIRGN